MPFEKHVKVPLTPAELALVRQVAAQRRTSIRQWARQVVLDAARKLQDCKKRPPGASDLQIDAEAV